MPVSGISHTWLSNQTSWLRTKGQEASLMTQAAFKQKTGTRPNDSCSKAPRDQRTDKMAPNVEHWWILNNMIKLQYIGFNEI